MFAVFRALQVGQGCIELICEAHNDELEPFPCHDGVTDGKPDPRLAAAILREDGRKSNVLTHESCCVCPVGSEPVEIMTDGKSFGSVENGCRRFTCGEDFNCVSSVLNEENFYSTDRTQETCCKCSDGEVKIDIPDKEGRFRCAEQWGRPKARCVRE